MADTPATDKLVKAEPEGPAPDPITSRSTSGVLLVCALLMMASLAWALWDEVYVTRPWKGDQQTFVKRYKRYLGRIRARGFKTEKEVKQSDEYKALVEEARAAKAEVQPKVDENNRRVKVIDNQLAAISDPFQDKRGRITVASYEAEMADEDDKADERRDVEELKKDKVRVAFPDGDGSRTVEKEFDFATLEQTYTDLKNEKGRLLAANGELLRESQELERRRDEYLKDNVTEVTEQQVRLLNTKLDNFESGIKQISVNGDMIVDRCETCHLGAREPLNIKASDMMVRGRRPDRLARAFVSHPSKELLDIHDPERFGCSSCHWGNGRATTSITKGHGRHKYWLHPLFEKENMEAGCNQCHTSDRVLQGAPNLTLGKDLFSERGCVGCHRYEGFDRETDALTNTRQLIKQYDDEITANERAAKAARAESAATTSDEVAQQLLARSEGLVVTNSQIEARRDELETQARYLMQDQKKVGPNLKDIRLKLRKEWLPVWLKDPQAFRPGTKMPTYWYLSGDEKMAKGNIVPASRQEEERKAIAAYLWQSAFEGAVPTQPRGDGARGKELFEVTGCMACHSLGEGEQKVGGDFAANLQRLGEKANYDYIVRWVHNPRERWAPYCPKHKRDLTPEDYAKHNKPYVFDARNSRCPEDGAELQVQNMTVMPNFRLTDQDARDIATYLVSLTSGASYPDASFMDDPKLKDTGRDLIKQYGCAGCHEIRGFEEEQRIGKELTAEGATPLERLDFAMLTHKAELGIDPFTDKKTATRTRDTTKPGWYDHKGFFDRKLEDPSVYDMGKEKEPRDHLRMPKPYLKPEWKVALTTFLLGSVGNEGANIPTSLFYQPNEQQKAIQDGWWVIKKYNCMGCHNVQVGQQSDLSGLPFYQEGGALGKEQLPPGLTTEGARVDPDWLLRFLTDPSLSGVSLDARSLARPGQISGANPALAARGQQPANGTPVGNPPGAQPNAAAQPNAISNAHAALKPQPGAPRNGVRTYLRARMPTFNFSPNELRTLVRFFQAVSAQHEPFIKEQAEPLTDAERELARALFTSQAAPCLKCHVTSEGEQGKTAPNFLIAGERLKSDWTYRWLLDPQRIMPGTAMPSELFKREGERWVFNGPLPPSAADYQGDHARLLVRYLLQLTPEEQARSARSAASAPAVTPAAPAAAQPATPVASHRRAKTPRAAAARPTENAGRRVRRARRQQASMRPAPARRARRGSRGQAAAATARPRRAPDFSR